MPIYEYECEDCQTLFEELVARHSEQNPPCPKCRSVKTEKMMSRVGGISTGGAAPCGPSGCANATSCGKPGFS